ncbi:hypothetical protein ACHAC9_02935 [Massilia sp. CMS3.1]|uniref:hypothetical protein n=1 Tax=Massilia sp. CMS3.1 TaxID=3373083 RepID=UPI003EE7E8E4
MRLLSILIPASLLALTAGAGAQDLPYPRTGTEAMSTVQVTAPAKPVLIQDDEAEVVTGAYAMSNGWRLKVDTGSRHINATIDKQKPMRLLAVAPYKFASSDGNVTMEFNRGPWGDDMVMSYVPDPRLAQVIVISSKMAQR